MHKTGQLFGNRFTCPVRAFNAQQLAMPAQETSKTTGDRYPLNVKFIPIAETISKDGQFRQDFPSYTDGLVEASPGGYITTTQVFAENAENIYNLKPRPDDVFVLTFPKSGNMKLICIHADLMSPNFYALQLCRDDLDARPGMAADEQLWFREIQNPISDPFAISRVSPTHCLEQLIVQVSFLIFLCNSGWIITCRKPCKRNTNATLSLGLYWFLDYCECDQ